MSKVLVPDVYAKVIGDVCEASRVDFEEGGVDLGALELLRQGWQKRLSDLKISRFPWDPNPEPTKQEQTSAPSISKAASSTLPSNGAVNASSSSTPASNPQIKQESQPYANQQQIPAPYQIPNYPQGQQISAPQRAAMQLHQRYGDQAANQIAALQNAGQQRAPVTQKAQQPQPQPQQQQQQSPFIKQEDTGTSQYQQNFPQQPPVKASQTDGAGDARDKYEAEIMSRRAQIAVNRTIGDRLMREHFLASQQQLEGGGLLRPLEDHRFISPSSLTSALSRGECQESKSASTPLSSLRHAQGDAAGDEEEDEDAINSDLDDPDDLDDNENDEDNVHEVMLCTYDKVQRVKNKWKCTLKDGILKVDGGDYVFHKGQGEFEW